MAAKVPLPTLALNGECGGTASLFSERHKPAVHVCVCVCVYVRFFLAMEITLGGHQAGGRYRVGQKGSQL